MSKKKGENAKSVLSNIINEEIPNIMEQIMANGAINIENKVTVTGLLNTALYHLRLAAARL